jgi:hypothetical protein
MVGFWDRLGQDEGFGPVHLPFGVNEQGQGPEDDSVAYAYVCWCSNPECPLTRALQLAWLSGKREGARAVTSDAAVEAATRAVWDHFYGGGQVRRYGIKDWPPPEQHMPWWRGIAEAALTAAARVVGGA